MGRSYILLIPLMLSVVSMCFWPVLNADFLKWDDYPLIVANQNYRGLAVKSGLTVVTMVL